MHFRQVFPCTWLCSANSEINLGKLWIYRIFHSTAKMWRGHLFFLTVAISISLQSYGRYIQRTFVFCPLLVLTHRLISAINAELCYAYFLVLFSFYFMAIFCVLIGTIYSIQRSGNIFDKSKYVECEVLQKLWAQGNRNVADIFCSPT